MPLSTLPPLRDLPYEATDSVVVLLAIDDESMRPQQGRPLQPCFSRKGKLYIRPVEAQLSGMYDMCALCPVVNPRRACARVTVVVACVCLSVCLSVCYRSSCFSVHLDMEPMILTGFS